MNEKVKNPAQHQGPLAVPDVVAKYGQKVHEAAHMLCEMMVQASDALAEEMFRGEAPAVVHVLAAEMAAGFWRRIARDENVPREDVAAMRKTGSHCALAHYDGHMQAQKLKQADLMPAWLRP